MRFTAYLSFFICCLVAAFSAATAQQLPQDSKLVKGKLKNGFSYYIYPAPQKSTQSAIQLFVKAGSLQENEDQRGLAHFVEHMAFNGSKNYPKNEVISFLESLGVKFGADLNAYTSYDQTVYKITVNTEAVENLHTAIDIVADWAFELSFDSLEIEKERGVIIEEWRTKQGASARLSEQYLPLIFYNSRFADRKTIGTLDVLNHFRHHTIKQFYYDWYRPNLMGIAIATNQDLKVVEKYIKKQFGKAKNAKKAPVHQHYTLPAHQDSLFFIATDKEEHNVDFSFLTKVKALKDINNEEKLKQQVVRNFFNSLSKKRFDRLKQKNSLFKSGSWSSTNLLADEGVIMGGASLYEQEISAGIKAYLYELIRLRKFGFTQTEIDDFRTTYLTQLQRSLHDASEPNLVTVIDLMKSDFYEGNTFMDRQDRNRLIQKLQEDIDSTMLMHYIENLHVPGNTVVMLTGPDRVKQSLPTKEQIVHWTDSIQQLAIPHWYDHEVVPEKLLETIPQAADILHEEQIEAIGTTKWTLSNDVTVYLKQSAGRKNHIQLTGFRRGGTSVLDSADYVNALYSKNILAASGAGNFTRQALNKFLIGNSASASLLLAKYREGVSANAQMKDMETMFQLLYLKWTDPRVDQSIFDLEKRNAIENTTKSTFSTNSKYNRLIAEKLSGDDDNDNISVSRLEQELQYDRIIPVFNKSYGSAKGFDFVVIGDFDIDSIKPYILTYLGGLPNTELPSVNTQKELPVGEEADIVLREGTTDKATVNIFYQNTDVTYDYPEILRYELIGEILKVKLRENLREKNSGVYGVGVSVSATSIPSPLFRARINFSCAPDRYAFLAEQVDSEIGLIAKDPAYIAQELENIKKQLLLTYNKQKEKETFWSAELRNHIYFGFQNWLLFTSYEEMLKSISSKEISESVNTLLIKGKKIQAVLLPEN